MNEQDRELLLRDLCARLPYKVKVKDTYYNSFEPASIWLLDINAQEVRIFADEGWQSIEYIKPYLFPLSSMTEEQKKEYESLCIKETSECTDLYGIIFSKDYYHDTIESIEFLYKNHIDIRGLIPKGLAIDCTNLNIY